MENNFKIKVPNTNFYLESNQTYRVESRTDSSAPFATNSKGERIQLPYVIPNGGSSIGAFVKFDSQREVWDTGLYKSSPCYAKVSKEQIEETIELIEKHLMPELKLSFPEDGLNPLSTNKKFDDYRFEVYPKRTYSTNTAKDFFNLWIALLSNVVVDDNRAEDKSTEIRTKRIPFILYSKEAKVKGESTKEFEKSKATSKFMFLLTSEKPHEKELLIDILNYIGVSSNKDTDEKLINSVFKNWIDNKNNSSKNVEQFNNTINYFSTEEGEEEMMIYKGLLKGKKDNTLIYKRGSHFIGEEDLGSSLKQAAKKIIKDDNLKEKFLELV